MELRNKTVLPFGKPFNLRHGALYLPLASGARCLVFW